MIKPFKFIAFTIMPLLLLMGCAPRFGPFIDDVNVLIAIYNANPGNTLSWDISDPESAISWEGVKLHRIGGQVLELSMFNKKISVLPPDIGRLTSMLELEIQWHDIEVIPLELFELPFLEKLNLSFGHKITVIPPEIGRLRRLEALTITFNESIMSIPAEIGNITTLRSINIAYNRIGSIPPEYGQLENLGFLDVSHNTHHLPLTVPLEIGRLRNLREFRMVPRQMDDGEQFPLLNVICELETLHGTDIDIYPRNARCL